MSWLTNRCKNITTHLADHLDRQVGSYLLAQRLLLVGSGGGCGLVRINGDHVECGVAGGYEERTQRV